MKHCNFDVVLSGGRVLDPASNSDATMSVGIRDGTIAGLSGRKIEGRINVDVSGLVVVPGFIDFHVHRQGLRERQLRALDGVTTAFDLEEGAFPVGKWYSDVKSKSPVNYGVSVSHRAIRHSVMGNGRGDRDCAKAGELDEICRRVVTSLSEGAIAIGYGLEYSPGAAEDELRALFRISVDFQVLNVVHIRFSSNQPPRDCVAALDEVVRLCAETGASAHVCHITSTGRRQTSLLLDGIRDARAKGLDLTTEVYPYTSSSTNAQSQIFSEGWEDRLDISYEDLESAASGRRLSRSEFEELRSNGGMVIAHIIPEDAVRMALCDADTLIVSDGLPFLDGRGHPRGAGTYARVLGRYVREQRIFDWMEAVRKMTLLPALRLQKNIPALRRKGRLEIGADADIAVFDPETVIDRASFEEPSVPSRGIVHVLVNGDFVVKDSRLIEDSVPGLGIRRGTGV